MSDESREIEIIRTGMELFDESFRQDPTLRDALRPENFKDFDSMYQECQTIFAHGFYTAHLNLDPTLNLLNPPTNDPEVH